MLFYRIAIMPIIDELQTNCNTAQAWYADDNSATVTCTLLLDWRIRLNNIGPKYGYFPNAKKTILIVKHPQDLEKAKTSFGPLGIKVTSEGQRHLGAVIGSPAFKKSYVESKVKKWTDDIEELADIAEKESQLAYAAFTKGICHRWTYFMRTIPDISELLILLEQKISERFIPGLL